MGVALVWTCTNGVEHNYYYVDGLLRTEEIGDSYIMNYRYDPNGTLVAVSRSNLTDGSSSILFAQTNTRGDVVSLYNSSGVVKVNYVYDSWGNLISATDGSGNALAENSVGALNAIRYRGYVYDSETGFYYLQSRYYDPETGRFLNADDVNYLGMSGSVLSYNAFAYCENNPVNNSDETGTIGTPLQWAFTILGAIVGLPFGKWLANRLGYYSGWRYYAIRTAAVVGGAALGWFAGSVLLRLIKTYIHNNPQIMIKIVAKYGPNILERIRRILGISIGFVANTIPYSWQQAEEIVRNTYNATKQTFTTTAKLGKRLVDGYNATKKTIYEVKYGYMSLSEFIKKEIAKDQYLLNSKKVKYVEWHFYISQTTGKGVPSAPLREAL